MLEDVGEVGHEVVVEHLLVGAAVVLADRVDQVHQGEHLVCRHLWNNSSVIVVGQIVRKNRSTVSPTTSYNSGLRVQTVTLKDIVKASYFLLQARLRMSQFYQLCHVQKCFDLLFKKLRIHITEN